MEKILIIDDNESLRYTLTNVLEASGFESFAVEDGIKGLEELRNGKYDMVICDMKLPGKDGLTVLGEIKNLKPELPVLMLTAFGDIKNAVEAIKQGAQDYLTKPFNNDEMIFTIKKSLEMKYLSQEVSLLRKKIDESYIGNIITGESGKIKEVLKQVNIVAPTVLTVLLQGESGTGKEVIANMIHKLSDRNQKPFVAVDCGAIPETLIESELFGHEKGAFTDAKEQKIGKLEQAEGGTLFLDEITNLSDSNQIKLLRVLQERKITRLGGKKIINLDVRIIAASNIRLTEAVNIQKFRADLYYRLNEFHIDLPALRDRKEDIHIFVKHFINDANRELGRSVQNISPEILKLIKGHSWPGNIRELRNAIRRAVLLTQGETIESIHMPDGIADEIESNNQVGNDEVTFEDSSKQAEKNIILKALEESGGNKTKAAEKLKMNQRTFYRKLKSLGIN
jgi:two-component system response regulator AtoC